MSDACSAELWYFYEKRLQSDIARFGIRRRILSGVLRGRRNDSNPSPFVFLK